MATGWIGIELRKRLRWNSYKWIQGYPESWSWQHVFFLDALCSYDRVLAWSWACFILATILSEANSAINIMFLYISTSCEQAVCMTLSVLSFTALDSCFLLCLMRLSYLMPPPIACTARTPDQITVKMNSSSILSSKPEKLQRESFSQIQ